jgi:hypothetical protein
VYGLASPGRFPEYPYHLVNTRLGERLIHSSSSQPTRQKDSALGCLLHPPAAEPFQPPGQIGKHWDQTFTLTLAVHVHVGPVATPADVSGSQAGELRESKATVTEDPKDELVPLCPGGIFQVVDLGAAQNLLLALGLLRQLRPSAD